MSSSTSLAARVCAGLFCGGAVVSTAVSLAPQPHGYDSRGFLAVGVISALIALLLHLTASRTPAWPLPLVAAIGTALISLDIYFTGGANGTADDSEVFFVWVALFAAYFFSGRQLVVQLALIAAAYLTVLSLVAPASAIPTRWVQTMGTLVVAAALVQMLRARVNDLVDRLTDAAQTDSLTGLLNRRGFEELMELEVRRARQRGRPLTLLLGDVDHFKQVNDLLGHAGGDHALARIAKILDQCTRPGDRVARTGGEEFAIVLPDSDARTAHSLAETLRELVEGAFADEKVSLTLSFGVAAFPAHAPSSRGLQLAADEALYAAKEMGRNLSVIFSDEVASMVSTEARERAEHAEVHLATLTSLAEALDQRDMGTAEHCQTVGHYCALVAEELGMRAAYVERVRIAGVLHDIGKIGLPDAILRKPGPLDAHEWDQVKKHPEIGAGILANHSFDDIRDWILAHHERPDGTGYPHGLKGPEIPLPSKILAVADAYEAMTANRPYREAMSFEVARTELLGRAGTRFDPGVVSALLRVVERERERGATRGAPMRTAD
jgi:diguanylate cyclase (GGDEF)-like protein/putative nucleotidyltransferase with HDIG domain